MPFLEVRDLTYTYPGGVRAVDGLDFDAERGEFIAVIGPNAAGKSTLALLLKGVLKAERGIVRVGGTERAPEQVDPNVGILFSNPENQIITSIVEEDIAFSLEVSGQPSEEIAGRVWEVQDRLGISHLGQRMPHLLSGGEQQMVALAGVLVLEPDILVLDEPTTFLDPDGKAAVLNAVRELARQGKVVILVTHDMSEAASADRVIVLREGRLVRDCAPLELFSEKDSTRLPGITPPFLVRLALALDRPENRTAGLWSIGDAAFNIGELIRGSMKNGQEHDGSGPDKGTAKAAVAFENIRFRYGLPSDGGKDLLSGLNLAIPDGSVAMICGSNGSGKSTLLQMANGLIEPDEGRVTYKGTPLSVLRKEKGSIHGRIALLFQNPERQLFSETVFEDIAFGPRNLDLESGEVRRRVVESAGWTGIDEGLLDRPVHSLSGGQMRRVAVAGVLAMDPAVLVLDEPTDSLDSPGVTEFYEGARKYCRQKGATIFMAVHSVPEEIRFIDHFSHLEEGSIRSSGATESVMTGAARTLPDRYLPDHLLLQEKLSGMGISIGPVELDPVQLIEKLKGMVKGNQSNSNSL